MELFTAFGIEWRTLGYNLLTFLILYGVLWKFGYQPIMKFVQERTEKIEKGVKDAQDAAAKLDEATAEHKEIVAEARKEAQGIIAEAKEAAEKQVLAVKAQGEEDLAAMTEKAKKDIAEDRERVLREAQGQAVELVMAATEKLLQDKVDVGADKAYVESIVKGVSK